jgi:hypothetical protein
LNYVNGQVSLRPDNVPDWAPAQVNFPLTTGYHLWTDQGSHAELHIGATAVRMADETALAVLNLDDHISQFSLTQGALNVRVPAMNPGEVIEVDTPNGATTLTRPGSYRFDLNADGTFTVLTVRAGEAEVNTGGQAVPVQGSQRARFSGDQTAPDVKAASGPDPWDQWCISRDTAEDRSYQASAPYIPPEMNGAPDLGNYGNWQPNPVYGEVWEPTGMPVGWAPYRYGHWAFIPPWGWTWIDDAPWGFAPFHYGRWVMVAGAWGWVPGRMMMHPIYAPALVAFVGGPRFGVGIGIGGIGLAAWIPLGPGEVFRPGYFVSPGYVASINFAHVTNVNVVNVTYVNRSFVTAVPQAAFAGARPVAAAAVRVPAESIGRMQPVSMSSVRPTREAMVGSAVAPGARVAAPSAAIANRSIVARTALPAATRTSTQVRMTANAGSNPGTTRPAGNATPARPTTNDRPPSAVGRPTAPQTNSRPATSSQPAQQQRPAAGSTPQRSAPPVPQRTAPKANSKPAPAPKKP